ncbi:hypothetical protein [Sphingobacterium yanglingense]|uniref:Uncharacterized protein n=1 Tax=Sphingobacterium yanglingense TaxID=1437280 RepID=A0A4R6WR00_9SPHI|nr:hypothetical protein [Sphingobacterium yanglingense]TDQ81078.1 hypothetical protein CLV99_0453 [Sphingobacterium yanglingense]
MENLKNYWLKGIMGLMLVLGVGYFAVNASEKKADPGENKTEKVVTAPDYLVNKGTDFQPRTSVNTGLYCNTTNPRHCVYIPTEEGMTEIPAKDSYSQTEIDNYVSQGWLAPHPSSSLALYAN